jgi:hypothetical protein
VPLYNTLLLSGKKAQQRLKEGRDFILRERLKDPADPLPRSRRVAVLDLLG